MREPKTDIARLQAAKVRAARADVQRLLPLAMLRWSKLCPAFELRKLAAVRRLLTPSERSDSESEVPGLKSRVARGARP
jgi:hypothetical protein